VCGRRSRPHTPRPRIIEKIPVAHLVKQVKGVSSHFVNETLRPEQQFKWQGGYAAFTISRWDLPKVVGYVKRQKEHHAVDELWVELEETFELVEPAT
jgi:putative transposase